MARNKAPETAVEAATVDASTPTEEIPDEPKRARYIGAADVKVLGEYVWDSQNEYTVLVEDVDGPTLEYLRSQPDFHIE